MLTVPDDVMALCIDAAYMQIPLFESTFEDVEAGIAAAFAAAANEGWVLVPVEDLWLSLLNPWTEYQDKPRREAIIRLRAQLGDKS